MNNTSSSIAQQLAHVASVLQQQRTGLAPKAVTAVLSEDTLVVTLHDALTPAEKALTRTPEGAAQVQEFHRQLFSSSSESMWQEIKRITGREVRDATAEIETATGSVVHAFTTGAMVQMFLLTPEVVPYAGTDRDLTERADDDGFRPSPEHTPEDDSDPLGITGRAANMATLGMTELATTNLTRSDALHSKQV